MMMMMMIIMYRNDDDDDVQEWCRDQCSLMTAGAACTGSCNIFRTMTWTCSSLVTGKTSLPEISGYKSL